MPKNPPKQNSKSTATAEYRILTEIYERLLQSRQVDFTKIRLSSREISMGAESLRYKIQMATCLVKEEFL